jgi:signal peptidase I
MEKEFKAGDVAILHKSKYYVPKLLKLFSFENFERNDIMIFQKDGMSFIKRCAGISGDTIDFRDSYFFINGNSYLENPFLTVKDKIQGDNHLSIYGKKNLYSIVPFKDYEIELNDSTYNLYKDILIKYETDCIKKEGKAYYVNGLHCEKYKFSNNYYYFIGDNLVYSLDSRVLGFIPEYYIMGKVFFHFRINKKRK